MARRRRRGDRHGASGLVPHPVVERPDAVVRSEIEQVCARLAAMGIDVGEATLPAGFEALAEAQKAVMAFEAATSLHVEYALHREQLSDAPRALIAAGTQIDQARHRQSLALASAQGVAIHGVFEHHDVLVTRGARRSAGRPELHRRPS